VTYEAQYRRGFTKADSHLSNVVRTERGDICHGLTLWEAGVIAWALNAAARGDTLEAGTWDGFGHFLSTGAYDGPKPGE
jgi:hypothetical protein